MHLGRQGVIPKYLHFQWPLHKDTQYEHTLQVFFFFLTADRTTLNICVTLLAAVQKEY